MRGFRARHKAKVVAREQAEAQAALAVVRQHAEAGKKAQQEAIPSVWAPPQMWSNPDAATAPPPPPPPPLPAPAAPPVPAELVRVLEVVTTMCDHVVEYIEADRVERRMMIDALTHLVRALGDAIPAPTTSTANGERLIGGSFTAGPDPSAPADVDIDLTQVLGPDTDVTEPETAVEVKCRFGDRWVDGFEICEAVFEGDDLRYRLRRRIDGVVLPELFDAADIRHVETFEELTSTPQHQKHWSAL